MRRNDFIRRMSAGAQVLPVHGVGGLYRGLHPMLVQLPDGNWSGHHWPMESREEGQGMGEIMTIQGVECYEKDGVAYLKLEAVARGLGLPKSKMGKST